MVFCITLPHLNGNKEHLLWSSMFVYTFKGVLFHSPVYIYRVGMRRPSGTAHLYQVRAQDIHTSLGQLVNAPIQYNVFAIRLLLMVLSGVSAQKLSTSILRRRNLPYGYLCMFFLVVFV